MGIDFLRDPFDPPGVWAPHLVFDNPSRAEPGIIMGFKRETPQRGASLLRRTKRPIRAPKSWRPSTLTRCPQSGSVDQVRPRAASNPSTPCVAA